MLCGAKLARGDGEMMVEATVQMLHELKGDFQ
jgi:ribosomal protein L24E